MGGIGTSFSLLARQLRFVSSVEDTNDRHDHINHLVEFFAATAPEHWLNLGPLWNNPISEFAHDPSEISIEVSPTSRYMSREADGWASVPQTAADEVSWEPAAPAVETPEEERTDYETAPAADE